MMYRTPIEFLEHAKPVKDDKSEVQEHDVRPVCMCRSFCRGCAVDVKCRRIVAK